MKGQIMKIDTVKAISRTIVGFSTGAVVAAVIKNNVTPENSIQKIEIAVGALAIGGVAGQYTQAYSDRMVDEVATFIHSFKKTESK